MEYGSVIAGLGAFGFWMFIGIAVIAGVWDGIKKREAKHETLRTMIESGKDIDPVQFEALLNMNETSGGGHKDLRTGGIITMFIAPGLALLGWVLPGDKSFMALFGVSLLVFCISLGLLVAANYAKRAQHEDDI